jgi:glycosyltransferase involved in cell wall biosynthesis
MPLVLTLHDIIYLEKISFDQGTAYQKFGNVYRKLNVPQVVPNAKKILTVSDFEKERIQKYFKLNDQKVVTAYNGVGSHFKRVLDQTELKNAKAKYNLPDDFIFFLGNTDPKKNVRGVLKALSILRKRNALPAPLVMLDINKDYLKKLAIEIGDLEILNHIHFTGYVPNKELPAIYSLATLFLYPSLRESFGIPLVEAMSCGVPVITSNTSSMPEIAEDAAIIVDPFNAETIANSIEVLWANKTMQNSLVEKGLKRAKHFSWDANASLTLKVYEEVLNN